MQKGLWGLLSDHLAQKMDSTLSDEGKIGKKYPEKTKLERLISVLSNYTFMVFGLLIIAALIFRLLVIYMNLLVLFKLEVEVQDIFLDAAETKLVLLIVTITLLNIFFIIVYIRRRIRPWLNYRLFFFIAIPSLSILSILPCSQNFIENQIKVKAIVRIELLRENKQYEEAISIINPLIKYCGDDDEYKYWAAKTLASIEADRNNFVDSIISYLGLFENITQSEITKEDMVRLQESIYLLGDVMGLKEAEKILQEIAQKFPYVDLNPLWLGAIPTSPIWFGITPHNYEYILEGDVNNIGYDSLEEYTKLQFLIEEYPDDSLADWGRIILGEYKDIADQDTESKVRDWAIYKTGLEAYKSMDFISAKRYFHQFLEEFPNHRWADDSAYRLARSYELTNEYDSALHYSMMSLSSPDGDMHYLTRPYMIALMDVYFSSETLKDFIDNRKSELNESDVAMLEFSLAELYFREEKFDSALVLFADINSRYPGSEVVKFVPHNLTIIDNILKVNNQPYPRNKLDFAKMLITNPADWGTDNLILYNELYEMKRRTGIENIGIGGPTWNYYINSNDHLHALKILDEVIQKYPNTPYVEEALYLTSIASYNLTYPFAFLPSNIRGTIKFYDTSDLSRFNRNMEPNCQSLYLFPCSEEAIVQILERIVEIQLKSYKQSSYAPETISIVAIAFDNLGDKDKTNRSEYWLKAINYLQKVYVEYPENALANNAMIYVARLYRKLAGNEPAENLKYRYLENAHDIYQLVLSRFPYSHVADEAKHELLAVMDEISKFQYSP